MSGTFPTTPLPAAVTLRSTAPTRVSQSHSMKRNVRSRGAQRYAARLEWRNVSRADMAAIIAFVESQRGQFGNFQMELAGYTAPLGSWAGTPVADVEGRNFTLAQRLGTETYVYSMASLGGGIVLAGTYPTGQVYRSIDSGVTWTLAQRLGTETYVLSIASLGGGIVLAGTAGTGQVYRSYDLFGLTVYVRGLTPSLNGVVKAGDLIRISTSDLKVYRVASDANSDASGIATITLTQALMASPADGAAITSSNVQFTVACASDVSESPMRPGHLHDYTLDVVEDV